MRSATSFWPTSKTKKPYSWDSKQKPWKSGFIWNLSFTILNKTHNFEVGLQNSRLVLFSFYVYKIEKDLRTQGYKMVISHPPTPLFCCLVCPVAALLVIKCGCGRRFLKSLCCWSAPHPGFFTMDLNVHLLDYHKVEGNICNPPKPLCTTLQRKVVLRNADFPGIWAWREIAISTEKRPPQPPGGFASANCNLTIPSVPPHGPFRKCYVLCQEHSGCDFVEFLKTTKCIHIGTNLQ